MKRRLRLTLSLCAIVAGLVVPLAPDAADAAGTTHTIYCRGGQGATEYHIGGAQLSVEKQFLHSQTKYDADDLAPGTCAWPNRGMTASEPYRLTYGRKIHGRDHVVVTNNLKLEMWQFSRRTIVERTPPEEFKAINALQDPNFIVELRVQDHWYRRKLRGGQPRVVKSLGIAEIGVIQQIGQSNRG